MKTKRKTKRRESDMEDKENKKDRRGKCLTC
jgi:hypothetical protein